MQRISMRETNATFTWKRHAPFHSERINSNGLLTFWTSGTKAIGQFRVAQNLCFKARLSANLLILKCIFILKANKTHFHKKGYVFSLVSKVRVLKPRKCPIVFEILAMTEPLCYMISLFLPALVFSNIPQPNFSILIIKITLDVQPIQLHGQGTSVSGNVFLTWSETFQENSQDNLVINKV